MLRTLRSCSRICGLKGMRSEMGTTSKYFSFHVGKTFAFSAVSLNSATRQYTTLNFCVLDSYLLTLRVRWRVVEKDEADGERACDLSRPLGVTMVSERARNGPRRLSLLPSTDPTCFPSAGTKWADTLCRWARLVDELFCSAPERMSRSCTSACDPLTNFLYSLASPWPVSVRELRSGVMVAMPGDMHACRRFSRMRHKTTSPRLIGCTDMPRRKSANVATWS
mmetsp:Transcript_11196/g.28240  ORF Transcript_11196/g.28240 Transcript_11196/m.28240 type:complete len:223 (+) Transcript_11196:89-757(+)